MTTAATDIREIDAEIPSDPLAHLYGFGEGDPPGRLTVTAKVVSNLSGVRSYSRRQGTAHFFRVPPSLASALKAGDFIVQEASLAVATRHGMCAAVLEVLSLDEDEDREQLKAQEDGDGTWVYLKTIEARDSGQRRYAYLRKEALAARRALLAA